MRAAEAATGKTAKIRLQPGPAGDVVHTEADAGALRALLGRGPATPVEEGLARFVAWYRDYHGEAAELTPRRSLRRQSGK